MYLAYHEVKSTNTLQHNPDIPGLITRLRIQAENPGWFCNKTKAPSQLLGPEQCMLRPDLASQTAGLHLVPKTFDKIWY